MGTLPALPQGACDSHIHINDPDRFAYVPQASLRPPPATVADLARVWAGLGLERWVIVQPSSYGTDNRCTREAAARLGGRARAVVVIDVQTSDAEVARLHALGARGVRFNLLRLSPVAAVAMREIAARIAPHGWHLQLHAAADDIPALAGTLGRLPVPVVFDHLGRLPARDAAAHPAFGAIAGLLDAGRAWVKLSGVELVDDADAPAWRHAADIARRLLALAPQRMVWGSNWPHPAHVVHGRETPVPADLLRWLDRVVGNDAAAWQAVLADNPAVLYGFGAPPLASSSTPFPSTTNA
ncbi:amidohydrolase family protein [Xylophilus sp.]|uniref:amidohydrolase family protein n=1 Tax=Xylophilus sp. TaxID=2653893 RepID=UPI002D7F03B2|nr:amidohydrolase family protein [Xylophilus sp.]